MAAGQEIPPRRFCGNVMAIDTDIFNDDLAAVCADLPAELVWGSQSISGAAGDVRTSHRIEDENGEYVDADLEWIGAIEDFTDSVLPDTQDTVTVDNVGYYVMDSRKSPDGVQATLVLRRTEGTALDE